MSARKLAITLAAFAACTDPKPERPKLADEAAVTSSTPGVSASALPSVAAPSAVASATADVSYPDDTIPAPSGSGSSKPPGKYVMDRVGVENIVKGYAKQAGSARGHGKDGIVIRRLQPDEALAQIGLRDGDVLQEINGFHLSDPEEALEAYAKLRKAARLDIKVLREGKPMTVVVEQK
jgi:general secretion pathway protein C